MTQSEIAEKWLKITTERLQKNIKKLNIGVSDDLINSITGRIDAAGDTVNKLTLLYNMYGKYVDMGVGKGIKKGAAVSKYYRKPKPWHSKQIPGEIKALSILLSDGAGELAIASILEEIPSTLTIDL